MLPRAGLYSLDCLGVGAQDGFRVAFMLVPLSLGPLGDALANRGFMGLYRDYMGNPLSGYDLESRSQEV